MIRLLSSLTVAVWMVATIAGPAEGTGQAPTGWQSPPADILEVLHAPQLPWVWTSPSGEQLFLADPVTYPPLAELTAPMHKLAGMRVNPVVNGFHGAQGATSPRLVRVESGAETPLDLPVDVEVDDVTWTADGRRFAITTKHADHMGLWVGSVEGDLTEIKNVALNGLLGTAVQWLPDQQRLLVLRIPERGPALPPPAIPIGPAILEGAGASARSTYEARNLLATAHDDALFEYYAISEPVMVDPAKGEVKAIGQPALYAMAEYSPDGNFLLVQRLMKPWSHAVPWWRFAREIEVWDAEGKPVASIASLPLADEVPIHGVPTGPRSVSWRATAPHTLFWVEALDGGNPVAEVPHRDRLMRLEAPFTAEPEEVFKAEHRIVTWRMMWGAEGGTLLLTQRERMRRWRYAWLLDVDKGTSRLWFDLDEDDRYGSPGSPLRRPLPNGQWVMRQNGDAVYFRGSGATEQGDRPFLDLRDMETGKTQRLFRCDPTRYEYFVALAGDEKHFVMRSESADDVPNYYLANLGKKIKADEGEATRAVTMKPITRFEDPAPQLREIEKRLVRYERADGVPLSFHLYLPPGYKEGTRLPTVLDRTAMPMLGDPETTYDTFVPQLVADAEAAVANLLAHTDLFRAGIARSGSYNKTNQPFGFQSERRSLFEARDVYIQVSPTFFADQVDEPVLVIHGDDDSNPGTLTFQSEVFFEAVRGSGGTARLVLLPHEDHGYRARESVEHVLWEQLRWFDKHVKGAETGARDRY